MSKRVTDYPILDIIRDRWSPRAMSGESISQAELMSLFEAARWAPSSYNNQPWAFIYAERDSADWELFLDLTYAPNRIWVHRASVLIVVLSRKLFFFDDRPSRTHSFDTGAAVENLALQGNSMGLVIHGMEGFDYERTRVALKVPEEYEVEAMFAVGKPGDQSLLPEQLKSRETPSDRKPISQFVFQGVFGKGST